MQLGQAAIRASPRPRRAWLTASVLGLLLPAGPGGPLAAADPAPGAEAGQPTVLLVVGAPGEEPFRSQFERWAASWQDLARQAQARLIRVGLEATSTDHDKDRLGELLQAEPRTGPHGLWLVLLGHGTYDGRTARFNLSGPDLAAEELARWLEPFRRPLVVVNAASASGPFLATLSSSNRVVLTATKSGSEQSFARFGQFFSAALGDTAADLDRDGQTSLLEAYLLGSRQTSEFYEQEGRLATEHALLDDNGDGLGTPADWFRGIHAVRKAEGGGLPDGLLAHQTHLLPSARERSLSAPFKLRRDALELAIARLRQTKAELQEEVYYERLEGLMVELARLYGQADSPGPPPAFE